MGKRVVLEPSSAMMKSISASSTVHFQFSACPCDKVLRLCFEAPFSITTVNWSYKKKANLNDEWQKMLPMMSDLYFVPIEIQRLVQCNYRAF